MTRWIAKTSVQTEDPYVLMGTGKVAEHQGQMHMSIMGTFCMHLASGKALVLNRPPHLCVAFRNWRYNDDPLVSIAQSSKHLSITFVGKINI